MTFPDTVHSKWCNSSLLTPQNKQTFLHCVQTV